jgi:glycosyltransferase involved in cell wall biosynthesis
MRVAIVRTMPEFSIDNYSDNLILGLKTVHPDWEIIELAPRPFERTNSAFAYRVQKYYERFWRYPRLVSQQIKAADIFHIVEPCDGHIVYWLKDKGKPIVVTCHDLINFSYPENAQKNTQIPQLSDNAWRYSVRGMKYADRIIAVSDATAKDTAQILNISPTRIKVVPNGVEAVFHPLSKEEILSFRKQQRIPWETTCVLNVGSNHPRKNIDNILKSIAILQEKGLPIQFWKVGADFSTKQKEFIKTHNLEKNVRYLGKPDKSTLCQIYNAADLLLAPSLYEGFGITLLEAMACGTPVITGNVSAMPEVVGDAGILVDPKNCQEIAHEVLRLHQNIGDRQSIIEQGIARTKLFTWKNTAEEVANLYNDIVKHA